MGVEGEKLAGAQSAGRKWEGQLFNCNMTAQDGEEWERKQGPGHFCG